MSWQIGTLLRQSFNKLFSAVPCCAVADVLPWYHHSSYCPLHGQYLYWAFTGIETWYFNARPRSPYQLLVCILIYGHSISVYTYTQVIDKGRHNTTLVLHRIIVPILLSVLIIITLYMVIHSITIPLTLHYLLGSSINFIIRIVSLRLVVVVSTPVNV